MSSLGKVMNQDLDPVQVTATAGEALALIEQAGLPGIPVIDKNHKLLGIAFKQNVLTVPPNTPLVK